MLIRIIVYAITFFLLISCTNTITKPNFNEIIDVTSEHYASGYPNPHNGGYCIQFHLLEEAHIKVIVIDSQNITVRHLEDRPFTPGQYQIYWDCRDDDDKRISSGVYYIKFNVNGFVFREGTSCVM